MTRTVIVGVLIMAALALAGRQGVADSAGAVAEQRVVGHRVAPARTEASDARVRSLRVPAGFRVDVFAAGVAGARMLAVDAGGEVYLSRPDHDEVVTLGAGVRAESPRVVLSGLRMAHGLAIHGGRLYVGGLDRVVAAELRGPGVVGEWRTLVQDLPDGGQHPKRTIGIGPDGMLYVSIGSSCNACEETNVEHATVVRTRLDGTGRTVFATGLRNTIGFAWHPATGELWGMDHGSDWRGDDQPPEELNRLVEGANYGWPYCYGARMPDELFPEPKGRSRRDYCAQTEPAVLTYQAHSAPIGMAFYTGRQFPREYRADAFVAMRGSWNRKPPTGYKVVRIRFEGGRPVGIEDFLTGFLVDGGQAHFGRPAGIAVAGDGALLVSDDTNGMIYRISATRAARR